MLTFVDMCPELNSESDSIRRRSISLLGKLLSDTTLFFDDQTAQVFFDFFYKRLGDVAAAEELLKAMNSLFERFPAAMRVCLFY